MPASKRHEDSRQNSDHGVNSQAVHRGNRDHPNGEKGRDRDDRSLRKACQAANAVTAGAAGAKPRAEADEKTGKRKNPKARLK